MDKLISIVGGMSANKHKQYCPRLDVTAPCYFTRKEPSITKCIYSNSNKLNSSYLHVSITSKYNTSHSPLNKYLK